MALAFDRHWQADLTGLVVTATGHGERCPRIEVLEAAHPIPSAAGQQAAERILQLVAGLTEHDLVVCLLSGGGSALLPLAGAWARARREAGRYRFAAALGRHDQRDQLRAASPVAHQGWPPGGRLPPGTPRDARHLRRARRRAARHCLGAHRCRSDDLCRRARGAGALRHRRAVASGRGVARRRMGVGEAWGSEAGPVGVSRRGGAPAVARGRCATRGGAWRDALDTLGPPRGRGEDRWTRHGRDSWPTSFAKGGRYGPHACCSRAGRRR